MDEQPQPDSLSQIPVSQPLLNDKGWLDGNTDYAAQFRLSEADIPALIALARRWTEKFDDLDPGFRPVYAWRTLAQLRATEAVGPLLQMQPALDELSDDWYLEEFPHVFGMVGPPVIDLLAEYLAEPAHGEFPRATAASGLVQVARRYPESRARIVQILSDELSRHAEGDGEHNGSLVSYLLDLNAVESAEVIERAYAANVVDPTIAGDWGHVKRDLGVAGLGLAPDKSPGWPTLQEKYGFPARGMVSFESQRIELERAEARQRQKKVRQQTKAKRKQSRKSRKRNRK